MGEKGARLDRILLAAASGALAAMTLAVCSCGGEVREAVEIHPGRTESNAATDVIVAEGGRILRDIAEARADIHKDYLLLAEQEIDRADRMLDSIEQSTPAAEVRDRTWVARRHLEYAEIPEVAGDLVLIYAAVDQVESLAPADSIRRHLDRTKRHLQKGNRDAAGRELARADQELLFVEVDLPLGSTRRHLAEAREALATGEPNRATESLQRAEDDLVFLTGAVRSPLGTAEWSLAKAVAVYAKGDTEGAERYLTLARRSLERASYNASEGSRTTLKPLLDGLRGFEGQIPSDRADALEKLEQLADGVRALAHPVS
jgi:cellobiose-specific phosphotransferase system component IIA